MVLPTQTSVLGPAHISRRTPDPVRTVKGAAPIRVWIDGELLHDATRAVSAFDRGLTLGDGVFETMRVLNGIVPMATAHLARLALGAERLILRPTTGMPRDRE